MLTVRPLSQCRKTVLTPLTNIQGTRIIKGYFLSYLKKTFYNHCAPKAFIQNRRRGFYTGSDSQNNFFDSKEAFTSRFISPMPTKLDF